MLDNNSRSDDKMGSINVRVDKDLKRDFKAAVVENGLNQTDIIVSMLESYVQKTAEREAKRLAEKK